MFQPFSLPFALAALLLSLTATAQATPEARSVSLTGTAGESPLLYLEPGTFTLLILDARIVRESVEVEGRARFAVVLPVQATLPPGGVVRIAVEVEMPTREKEEWLEAPHSLRVCNADGSRCLFVPTVTL